MRRLQRAADPEGAPLSSAGSAAPRHRLGPRPLPPRQQRANDPGWSARTAAGRRAARGRPVARAHPVQPPMRRPCRPKPAAARARCLPRHPLRRPRRARRPAARPLMRQSHRDDPRRSALEPARGAARRAPGAAAARARAAAPARRRRRWTEMAPHRPTESGRRATQPPPRPEPTPRHRRSPPAAGAAGARWARPRRAAAAGAMRWLPAEARGWQRRAEAAAQRVRRHPRHLRPDLQRRPLPSRPRGCPGARAPRGA